MGTEQNTIEDLEPAPNHADGVRGGKGKKPTSKKGDGNASVPEMPAPPDSPK